MYFDNDTKKSSDQIKDGDTRAAEVLVSDCVANYKTVASFGNDHVVLKEYKEHLERKTQSEIRAGRIFGLSWGVSQFVINFVFGLLYLA